jgi:hypothetical protein
MVILRVDLVPGTSIENGVQEMVEFSRKLNVMATTSFNGFHLIAHPNSNAGEIVDQYKSWCAAESKCYKASQLRPSISGEE